MADESQVLRGINWRETFPFTNIFRAFRVAIHPSKLILALITLVLISVGGWALDAVWPAHYLAVPNELIGYSLKSRVAGGGRPFKEWRAEQQQGVQDRYAALLAKYDVVPGNDAARAAAANGEHLRDLENKIIAAREEAVKTVNTTLTDAKSRQGALDVINTGADEDYVAARSIKGRGLFREFFAFEVGAVNRVIDGVRHNDWLGGVSDRDETRGVIVSVVDFFVIAPVWAMRHHPVYFSIYGLYFMIIWAVFGGAISRIAAVHVAREEKLSVRQALRFSVGKFLSFCFAPIIPLLIVLFVGLLVTVASLLGNIPWLGPIVVGAFFFLALAAGFVMTLVLFGTLGGLNLMYPTVAVEGSDSFDAISRSFSYVYARPWRMLFLTLVAIIYGALTFLFVRFFIQTMLALTHTFYSWGMVRSGFDGVTLAEKLWPYSPARLFYHVSWLSLTFDQKIGAALIMFWVFLVVALLGAFAISFYFSANTIIYYLMRREVDATELDDVYVEQSEEDFGDAPAAPAASTTSSAATPTPSAAPDVVPPPDVTPSDGAAPAAT